MLDVTERAAVELQVLRAVHETSPDQGVKLVADPAGQVGMVIGEPQEGDDVIQRDEQPLLIVDAEIAPALDGAVLDCETAEVSGTSETRFALRRES